MKTIKREFPNHTFEIRFEPDGDVPAGPRCFDVIYRVDGVLVHHGDFNTMLALLTAEWAR